MACPYCGQPDHRGMCPRVKSIEYEGDGVTVRRVELHEHGEVRNVPVHRRSQPAKNRWPSKSQARALARK